MKVDFPEPDGPTRNTNSPLWISAVAFFNATTSPLKILETPSSLITWEPRNATLRSGRVVTARRGRYQKAVSGSRRPRLVGDYRYGPGQPSTRERTHRR